MFIVYAVPTTLGLAFAIWAVASRRLSAGPRRAAMVVAIVIGCGVWTLARTNGIHRRRVADLEWRWTPTAEERLFAQARDKPPLRSQLRSGDGEGIDRCETDSTPAPRPQP